MGLIPGLGLARGLGLAAGVGLTVGLELGVGVGAVNELMSADHESVEAFDEGRAVLAVTCKGEVLAQCPVAMREVAFAEGGRMCVSAPLRCHAVEPLLELLPLSTVQFVKSLLIHLRAPLK